MSNVFFIGDTHFGHTNIVKFENNARPFASIEEHDEALVKNWNGVVRKKDIVWVMGDFAFGAASVGMAGRLNGEKKLVMGNHDHYPTEEYMKHFTKLYGAVSYKHALLTHIPCHPDQLQRWSYNIHGHTHSYVLPDDRYINVSAEQINYTPVSWDELKKKMLLRAFSGNDGVPPLCIGCGKNSADPPSSLCPGCQAYHDHNQ